MCLTIGNSRFYSMNPMYKSSLYCVSLPNLGTLAIGFKQKKYRIIIYNLNLITQFRINLV